MDGEAPGRSLKTVKIEARDAEVGRRFGLVQNFQPPQAARTQTRLNMTAAPPFEQFGKTIVPEAPDHAR